MIDHPLLPGAPDPDIRYVKRLWIYITAGSQGQWVDELDFHIAGHTAADRDETGGTQIGNVGEADQLIDEFIAADQPEAFPFLPTPLDFSIEQKCFVVLKLYGDFWEFSARPEGAVRTKRNLGKRYYNLQRHESGNGLGCCVSFCADEPHKASDHVRHAINLYVDFLANKAGQPLRLPVIIDPDVENKGRD